MTYRSPSPGTIFFCLLLLLIPSITVASDAPFRRGDVNDDGGVDISDPIGVLDYLFNGSQAIDCLDATDVNDTGPSIWPMPSIS